MKEWPRSVPCELPADRIFEALAEALGKPSPSPPGQWFAQRPEGLRRWACRICAKKQARCQIAPMADISVRRCQPIGTALGPRFPCEKAVAVGTTSLGSGRKAALAPFSYPYSPECVEKLFGKAVGVGL